MGVHIRATLAERLASRPEMRKQAEGALRAQGQPGPLEAYDPKALRDMVVVHYPDALDGWYPERE